ncbi:MAG TPA: carboxymuconolactone decarboxylase family protein [Cyclobacteriaceae bacterium]
MKTINVPTTDQLSPESNALLATFIKRVGKIPNLYATIGYSSNALKATLSFEEDLKHGIFSAKEQEAIHFVVSQVNGCDYCLAAHSLLAMKRGYSKEETLDLRRGLAVDPKLQTALQVAKAMTENKGNVGDQLKDAFFSAGYNEAALMELAGLVTLRTFTNYVFALTKIPVDYPLAERI